MPPFFNITLNPGFSLDFASVILLHHVSFEGFHITRIASMSLLVKLRSLHRAENALPI